MTPKVRSIRTRHLKSKMGCCTQRVVVRIEGRHRPLYLDPHDGSGPIDGLGQGGARHVRAAVQEYIKRRDALSPEKRLLHAWGELRARDAEVDRMMVEAAREIVAEDTATGAAGVTMDDLSREVSSLDRERDAIIAAAKLIGCRQMPWHRPEVDSIPPLYEGEGDEE